MTHSSLLNGVKAAAMVLFAALWAGCEGGDGDAAGESVGSSTILGTVESFDAPAVSAGMTPLAGAIVRSGIRVRLLGTELTSTTAEDGLFVMSGVPAGRHTLRFEYQGVGANYQLNVPEDAEVVMNRIRIRHEGVTCDSVQVRQRQRPPESAPNQQGGGEGDLDRDRDQDRDQVQAPDRDQERTRSTQAQ